MEAVFSAATENPLVAAILALGAAWLVASWFVQGRGVAVGAVDRQASQDAMQAARQRQQAALEAALAARGSPSAGVPKASAQAEPTVAPTASSHAGMPARMAAALARAENAGPSTPAPSAPSAPSSGEPSAPPTAPDQQMPKPMRADDPNSVTQRLRRIEKGKGPTDHNPLQGHASGSTAGSSFACKRKGG